MRERSLGSAVMGCNPRDLSDSGSAFGFGVGRWRLILNLRMTTRDDGRIWVGSTPSLRMEFMGFGTDAAGVKGR